MPENRKETVMFLCRKAVSSEQYRPLSEREAVLFDGHQKVYKGVYRHLTRFESPLREREDGLIIQMKDLCKQFFLFLCEFHRTCFLLRKRKQIFYETLPIGARCNAVEFLENLRVGLGVWHPAFSGNLFNRSFPFQKVLQRFPDSHIGQIFDKGKSGIAGEQSGGIAGAERKRFLQCL